MGTLIIFEDGGYRNLLPLTYWRTIGELRTGYWSLLEQARRVVKPGRLELWCRDWLAAVAAERLQLPVNGTSRLDGALLLNARVLLTTPVAEVLAPCAQWEGDEVVAIRADRALLDRLRPELLLDGGAVREALANVPTAELVRTPQLIRYPWDLVHANPGMLHYCWNASGEPARLEGRICEGVFMLNKPAIHVGKGSTIKPGVVLDAEHGPIFIGDNVTVSPCTSIEGPCYIGDGSLIQPGSALRDAMSIGRRCKVGGELESSIIHGFSNKQHDGFLGHAYIGEWVNLAADTVNSDLKNTYGNIRVPINGVEVESGQMFVGLTMGDHSKTGIGQMFPTGAVVGFGCNVAFCQFSPRFVPSFTWITKDGACGYDLQKCIDTARRVMARRQTVMTPAEETLFRSLPDFTATHEVRTGWTT